MPFPQDLPRAGFQNLLALFGDEKPTLDVAVLAIYDLVGYGLGQYFGDVKYPVGASLDLAKVFELLNRPEFVAAQEAVSKFVQYTQVDGLPRWRALLKILIEYGPEIVKLVLAILAIV